MSNHRIVLGVCLVVCLLLPLSAAAAINKTELAGNPLGQYPFFEYVRAFNVNAPINVAIDPTRFPAIVGDTCDVYVVNHKTPSQWTANATLTDVTAGGMMTRAFVAGNIQANTFAVAGASELSANAGMGLGVGYDVVLDCDQNGLLSDGDFIDGLTAGEAGLYAVHDTTAAGPAAVTEESYNLPAGLAATYGFPATHLAQDLYFPTSIASMGKRPLVVIGHGAGHSFDFYDHIGFHLASYGYVVVSIDNDISSSANAAFTQIGHTDAFLDQAEAGAVGGGALAGHIDRDRIVWIGHSRGGEGVTVAYDRLFDGTSAPTHYNRLDIRLVSSMLPTDFNGTNISNPHDANYHLWTAAGDSDVNGSAGDLCPGFDDQRCQTFHLHDRATAYRQSTVVQGTGHGWFHDEESEPAAIDLGAPCHIDENITHLIQLGYLLPLVEHYVKGNIPALDYLTRQYESFHPPLVPIANPCVVVSNEYRNGAAAGNFMIDDYQTNTATNLSSSGAMVSSDVDNLAEGRLDDSNTTFTWIDPMTDPFNGATQGNSTDTTRGVVFDWTGADRFYEWTVPALANDFTKFSYLSFRGAQGTRHPNTLAAPLGDLTFSVTLRDNVNATSTIRIDAYGGGLEQPYARNGGWHNEMETIRIRTTDFLHNGATLNLANVAAVRLDVGPTFGSNEGRVVIDELMLTNDVSPLTFDIIEPTTGRPAFAGTSVAGSRVLVRLTGTGLDLSPGNMTISVDGVALTALQIPTPAVQVGGETWIVIAPGPKANGCYDLSISLTTPSGPIDTETQSLCWADDEARVFDRVLAIDQTNSMHYDGSTLVFSTAKMEAARAAAKFFVDLSNADDKIGVISFQRRDQNEDGTIVDPGELAEPKFPIVTAGEGPTDERGNARDAIDDITPDTAPGFSGAETSPGAGLVEAQTMIGPAVPNRERNIVLLTDGLENYPPKWADPGPGGPLAPIFAGDTIRIDTVGVGGDADDELLLDIANMTGGEFRNLNEGSGSFFLLSRLADFYKAVDEDVRGEQRFYYAEGFPTAGISISNKRLRIAYFEVEPGLDWMTVAFHANIDNGATVALFTPGNVQVMAAPPLVTVRSDPKHSVYRIRLPQPGTWSYIVQPNAPAVEFFAVASAPTSLTARIGPDQMTRRPGGDYSMPLRVWIADRLAVRGASVSGYVRRPDGVKTPITLSDNGLSVDGAANDGIYGLDYPASIPGAYYVKLTATGTSNAGEPYERSMSTGFVVPGQPKRPLQPGEGLPTRPSGERCACEIELRRSLSFFGGITLPHGAFDAAADPSYSLGIKPAIHANAFGGRASLGLYLGRDNFDNPGHGSDFHLTHLSPELELSPGRGFCPVPSVHIGIGAYRNENGAVAFGFNAGLGLSFCLTRRISFLSRYDYRSVEPFDRDYSTLQIGLRWNF